MANQLEKKRTWTEITLVDYYEEEQEMMSVESILLRNLVETRRFLYSIGEYELEEGEILE